MNKRFKLEANDGSIAWGVVCPECEPAFRQGILSERGIVLVDKGETDDPCEFGGGHEKEATA